MVAAPLTVAITKANEARGVLEPAARPARSATRTPAARSRPRIPPLVSSLTQTKLPTGNQGLKRGEPRVGPGSAADIGQPRCTASSPAALSERLLASRVGGITIIALARVKALARVSADDHGRWGRMMASRNDPASMLTEPRAERVFGSRDSIDA
jgi:hypothetical protein